MKSLISFPRRTALRERKWLDEGDGQGPGALALGVSPLIPVSDEDLGGGVGWGGVLKQAGLYASQGLRPTHERDLSSERVKRMIEAIFI